ncbi:MAG: hypothetical protein MHM6MM_007966 [Cercozoa sp. M6MM]
MSNSQKWSFPSPFQHGHYGSGFAPRTLVEQRLDSLRNAIARKPEWTRKIKTDIRDKWVREMKQQGVSTREIDYVMAELDWYAARTIEVPLNPSASASFAAPGVYIADNVLHEETLKKLRDLADALMSVPKKDYDWHPGSNETVLDLVHPSLYPLIYGVSRVTETPIAKPWVQSIGDGKVLAKKDPKKVKPWEFAPDRFASKDYQWLPAEFQVAEDGSVSVESYINNLHPRHTEGYDAIAASLAHLLPMFEACLEQQLNGCFDAKIQAGDWYEHSEEPEEGTDEEDSDFEQRWEEWQENRSIKLPEVPEFAPLDIKKTVSLKGRRLQAIVKMATIELTPEKPRYEGGSWHVEGMQNENIVASGIIYFQSDNVQDTTLCFRQAVCEPDYEQGDERGVAAVYGLADEEALNEPAGEIMTSEKRAVVFPNALQHQVQPFELEDKTKPGTRRILCFFLVHPDERIVSTETVPPQQAEWFAEEVKRDETIVRKMPEELAGMVANFVGDWPMSLESAREHREKLMHERKFFVNDNNTKFFERPFSLCEH